MVLSPRSEGRLEELYAKRWTEPELAAKSRLWKLFCDSFLARYVPAEGTVLDIGSGYCDFINNIDAARRIAIDVNPETARRAAPGVEVHLTPLEQLCSVLEPESIDLAFACNVFEHLRSPDALLEILESVHCVLRPGGLLIVLQPNIRWVGTAFWDFVDHTLPLTERGMAEALELSGFVVTECRSKFLPYTIKRQPLWNVALARIYLALPPIQWLLGKQMFLVARRIG
jgi:SAM-dependent methyltransferase